MDMSRPARRLAQHVVLQAIYDQAAGKHNVSPSALAPWVTLAGIRCRDLPAVLGQAGERLQQANLSDHSDVNQSAASIAARKAWAARRGERLSLRARLNQLARQHGGRIVVREILNDCIASGHVPDREIGYPMVHRALCGAPEFGKVAPGKWVLND
jgi:hypothetical protein